MSQIANVHTDSVILSLQRAQYALTEAKTIQQTKMVLDVAAAAEIYARRQKLGQEAEDMANTVKVDALQQLGAMLKAAPKNTGAKGIGKSAVHIENRTPTLEDIGIDKKTSAMAQKLASLPQAEFEQVRDGHQSIAKAIAKVEADKQNPKTAPKPAPAQPNPEPEAPPDYTDLEAAYDQITELQSELVVARMGDIPEDQKTQAAERIEALQAEVNTLTAVNRALVLSRDALMSEVAQLKKQCQMQRRELEKAKASA